ncbi:GAF domain-containing protein, partial [bacterium]|nr:GAF domain-containing protein [bacterium]
MLRGNEHTIAGAGDPPDRNPLMALTALFDGHFSIDWIVELTNLKISQVISILEDAVRQKKIVKLGSGLYSTQNQAEGHDPLKSFDTSKKRDYHNRIAGLLLRDLPDNEEKAMVLSHHLLQTSNDLDRCRYLVKAGDNNLKSFKTQKAFECHAKVLNDISALTGKEADQLFTETAIKYSKISIGRNDTSKVLGILREALFRAIRLKDKSRQALLEMHIAKNEWIMGKYSSAMSHFNKGWDLAAKQDDPNLRRSAITFNSFFLYWQGRYQEVVESYEKAVSDVEVFPKGQFPLLGTSTIGYCYTQVGQVTQGLGMIDAVRNICLKRGDLNLASFASGNLGCVMLDINRVDYAIEHLKMSAREAIEAGNKWVLLSAYLVLAYCYYKKGEKSHCAGYFCEFIKERKEIKMGVSLYSYLMDLLWVMEQGDLPKVRGWSLEQEIQQGIKKENLFIKGIAYRYKSLLGQKRGMSDDERIGLLNQSLEILKKTGHQLQIAETEMEIARLDLLLGKNAQAKKRMKTVSRKLSGYSETLIPNDLKSLLDKLPEKEKLFEEILEMGQKMATAAHDSDFTKKAISAINRMTGAERGALFLFSKKDRVPKLRLHASNNLTLSQVNHPNFSSSMKMLEEVARTGEACITGPDTDSDFFSEEHIRSRICVPMIHQKRVIGVFYNDNRLLSSAFKQSDLKLLSYFAAQAALTLDNARAYNEIKYLNEQLRQQNK